MLLNTITSICIHRNAIVLHAVQPNRLLGVIMFSILFFSFLGYVYNYNETGVHRDITGWSECIAVQLVKSTRDSSFTYTWDAKLHEFTLQADWGADR